MVKSKGGVPRGYQAVMPYLRMRDAAAAIKFYKKVFGAKENFRLKMAGKVGHAELDVGGAVIMLSDEFPDAKAVGPKTLKGTSVHLATYVENADKVVAKAVKAGAKIRQAVQDQFYGDRMGQIEDPFGHVWSIHTRIKAVSPRDMQKRLDAMLRGEGLETRAKPAARKPARRKATADAPTAVRGKKAAPRRRAGSV
ncbi:MAG: VOC family protein [Hyphomicrobiaceae bacterium]|nr:VOC family protein [Hyphomicrobiaceae bacterium]